ncbi:MAG: glycosyltransferase family 39 protein [Anaerolineaceae bacterium]|nr:glycosyltransferase family 39 protein [Anaerolineaceae bacterium]
MFLLLGVFALYLHQLDGASLWRDEALTVIRAEQSFGQIFANRNIVQGVSSPDLHPPLYFLILHLWQQFIGRTEFAYRLPSLFFMVMAVAFFYHLAKQVWGKETAVGTLLLVMLSPFFYWYAREARMYALLVLETLVFYRTLWSVLQPDSRWWHFVLLGIFGLLLVMTHYTGLFVIAFAAAILLFLALKKRPHWGWSLSGLILLIVGGIILAPHLLELLGLPEFFAFSQRQLWVLAQEGINTFSLGSAGPLEEAGWRLWPFVALGLLGMFTAAIARKEKRWQVFLLGSGGFLLTLLVFFAASWLKANYSNPRHLTVLSVAWFLLMGQGLAMLWRQQKLLAVGMGLVVVSLSGQQLWRTIQSPPIVKDDVRTLAEYIESRRQPGDVVLWHSSIMMTTYDYYASDLPYTAVPKFGTGDPTIAQETLSQLHEAYDRIWFVSAPAPPYFDPNLVPTWLKSRRIWADSAHFPASWASLHLDLLERANSITELPAAAIPADLSFGNYRLQAIRVEERFSEDGVWVSLYWRTTEINSEAPAACLRLEDSTQNVWSEGCASLALPQNAMPNSEVYYRQQLWLPLSRGMPPILYDLSVRLESDFVYVGKITLPAWEPPAPEKSIASYNDVELQLVSLNWQSDEFRAGLWAIGHLLWYATDELPENLSVQMRLVDFWGRTVAEQTSPLGSADHSAAQWLPHAYGQTPVNLPLPFTAEGQYLLQVQLTDENGMVKADQFGSGNWVNAGWVQISSWPIVRSLPEAVNALDGIAFGEAISLASYQLNRSEDILTVDLFWESEAALDTDYVVFIHVGQAGVAPLAQSSNEPANWLRPTSSWRVGEIVQDSHQIRLSQLKTIEDDDDLLVMVGFYAVDDTNARLPLTVDGTAVPNNIYILQPLPLPANKP